MGGGAEHIVTTIREGLYRIAGKCKCSLVAIVERVRSLCDNSKDLIRKKPLRTAILEPFILDSKAWVTVVVVGEVGGAMAPGPGLLVIQKGPRI